MCGGGCGVILIWLLFFRDGLFNCDDDSGIRNYKSFKFVDGFVINGMIGF